MENNAKKIPDRQLPITTAGIDPEKFSDDLLGGNRRMAVIILVIFLVIGFALRVNNLGSESLGEDELNKLQTVDEYRLNGLSGKNGEHPFLMKGLQTISVSAVEKINSSLPAGADISREAALRFPVALFGTFTALLIFLLVSELFGGSIGLISAILWTVEPVAIGFDRIAKEDSLVLFFFLLTNLLWIRGQTAAQSGNTRWTWYAWGAAAGFAGLMASKYYPHLLAIVGAYYIIFQYIPATRWRMESVRWLKFFAVMGVTFLVLNPTIVLPETWHEMLKFSSENRIGHDSYEFMGALFVNKMSAWLNGVPWTFYYVFIAVKTSLVVLALFAVGLPLIIKRKMGDGRFFLFFWAFFWFMPFTLMGGKFVRYFTLAEPLILIVAAVGVYFAIKWITDRLPSGPVIRPLCQAGLLIAFIAVPLWNSLTAAPHFRLFTNALGGGWAAAGSYFPHDEFYDGSTAETVSALSSLSPRGTTVACETPTLFEYYAATAGRNDLVFISLSDRRRVEALRTGDFVVLTKGRRYFSNTPYFDFLRRSAQPVSEVKMGDIPAAAIYRLDAAGLAGITGLANEER